MDKKALVKMYEAGDFKIGLIALNRPCKVTVLKSNEERIFGHYVDIYKGKTYFLVKLKKDIFNIGHAMYKLSEFTETKEI